MKQLNKIKILYVHEYAFGYDQPGFTKPIEILSILQKKGYDVVLISGMYSHITRKKLEKYKNKLPIYKEEINGVKVIRVSGFFNLTSFLCKFLNHFVFMLLSILSGLFIKNISIIYASSPSPFAAFSGYFLSVIKKAPFLLEIRDLWPEDLIQEGFLKKGLVSYFMEKSMVFLYKKANLIITVTNGIKEGIIKRIKNKEKVIFIPNSVNLELFDILKETPEIKKNLNIENNFILLYAGNHGLSNALDKIIDAANILKNYKDIKFIFIGSGEKKLELIKRANNYNLNNVIFLDSQPKNKMPQYFSIADVCIIPLKNIPIYEGALPNKLLDSMASSKPILLAMGKEAKNIVEEAGCGISVEPENSEEISKGIIELYNNKHLLKEMGEKGRKYVEENFSNLKIAEKLEKVLVNVVERKTNFR